MIAKRVDMMIIYSLMSYLETVSLSTGFRIPTEDPDIDSYLDEFYILLSKRYLSDSKQKS